MRIVNKIIKNVLLLTIACIFIFGAPLVFIKTVNAQVLLRDRFEYGAPEPYPGDNTGAFSSVMVTQDPWAAVQDSREDTTRWGEFSIVDSSGVPFTDNYTGKIPEGNYVLRMHNTNTGGPDPTGAHQSTANMIAFVNLGTDWWLQFWMARALVMR